MTTPRVWLIGAGNMAGAMLRRWLASGALNPASVTIIKPTDRGVPDGVRHLTAVPTGEGTPDVLLLGIKPQLLAAVAPTIAEIRPTILISILAGVDLATLARLVPARATVRAMPNLPVGIGKGVTALHATDASDEARGVAEALMAPLGLVEWIATEALFDAVTALSGCGPGFVYRFIDALADAGTALGLPADQAARLALATVEGSGLLAAAAGEPPAVLADRVASPGGSTRAGLNVLDAEDALKSLLRDTLAASARRNAEMAAAARG